MKTLHIRLTPRASTNKVGEIIEMLDGTEALTVYVTECPEDGKANKAMIDVISKHIKVNKSKIKLIAGHKSRDKILQITD